MTDQALVQARAVKLGIRLFTAKILRLISELIGVEAEIHLLETQLHQKKRRLAYLKKRRDYLINEILEEADPNHRRRKRR